MICAESGTEPHQLHFIQSMKGLEKNSLKNKLHKKVKYKGKALKVIKTKFPGKGSLNLWLTWAYCHQ